MQWPKEILAAFQKGMTVEPLDGLTAEHALRSMLEETLRRVVWRARCDPKRVSGALRAPYTPLGSVTPDCGRWAKSVCLHGTEWGAAVDKFYDFVEANAAMICQRYADEQEPYHDMTLLSDGLGEDAP